MKLYSFLFCFCLSFLSLQAKDGGEQVLRVSNWIDYIDERLIAEFERWYEQTTGEKVRVVYDTYVMPDSMYNKVADRRKDYDVCCPPEYLVERMYRHNLLLPIDTACFRKTGTPNWTNCTSPFLDRMIQAYDELGGKRVKDYAIPYQWGTTGVVFNTDHVKREEVESWDFLFDRRFKNRIRVKDAFSDLYTILVIYANREEVERGRVSRDVLASSLTEENLEVVKEHLMRMSPQIAGWEFDEGRERMANGEDWLAVTWNGEAQWARNHARPDVHLDFLVPREGSDLWVDCWVIPAYAKNVKAASYWINFFCRPDNALRCMHRTQWTSAIATSEMLAAVTDESVEETTDLSYFFGPAGKNARVSRILYPEYATVERLAIMRDVGDRQEAMRGIWDAVKANHSSQTGLMTWVMVGVAVLVLLGVWMFFRRRKK